MSRMLLTLLLILSLFIFTQPVLAQQVVEGNTRLDEVETRQLDLEALILSDYFAKHNSPLQAHAQDFVDAAKMYDLDWRLVPSIAGVESTFGKFIPGGHGTYTSYNAWGWGASSPDVAIHFASWKHGIYTVSKGLKENYVDRGYTEPFSMNRIYAASPTWGSKVTFFMNALEKFAVSYQTEDQSKNELNQVQRVAVDSGQLLSN